MPGSPGYKGVGMDGSHAPRRAGRYVRGGGDTHAARAYTGNRAFPARARRGQGGDKGQGYGQDGQDNVPDAVPRGAACEPYRIAGEAREDVPGQSVAEGRACLGEPRGDKADYRGA